MGANSTEGIQQQRPLPRTGVPRIAIGTVPKQTKGQTIKQTIDNHAEGRAQLLRFRSSNS